MKHIISLLILTNFSNTSLSLSINSNDSVSFLIRINDTKSINDTIYFDSEIYNYSDDTILILVQPSLLEDNKTNEKHLWKIDNSSLEFSSPSTIFLEESYDEIKFLGDGVTKLIFDTIPLILPVKPKSNINFVFFYTSEYLDSLSKTELRVWGYLTYAFLKELKQNINNEIFNEFKRKILYNNNIEQYYFKLIPAIQLGNLVYKYQNKEEVNQITKIIWDNFRYYSISFRNYEK